MERGRIFLLYTKIGEKQPNFRKGRKWFMEVKVMKEIRDYKEAIFFGLSVRQDSKFFPVQLF